jgi:hypothetical protein
VAGVAGRQRGVTHGARAVRVAWFGRGPAMGARSRATDGLHTCAQPDRRASTWQAWRRARTRPAWRAPAAPAPRPTPRTRRAGTQLSSRPAPAQLAPRRARPGSSRRGAPRAAHLGRRSSREARSGRWVRGRPAGRRWRRGRGARAARAGAGKAHSARRRVLLILCQAAHVQEHRQLDER